MQSIFGEKKEKLKRKLLGGFDPYQVPPNLDICNNHQIAQQVKMVKHQFQMQQQSSDNKSKKVQRCDCCKEIIYDPDIVQDFPINSDVFELGSLGAGIALQFTFNKAMIIYMAVIFCVSGIYFTNYCMNHQVEQEHIPNYILSFSFIYKDLKYFNFKVLQILNLVSAGLIIAITVYFNKQMLENQFKIDAFNCTPADFTLQIDNIPKKQTDKQIVQFLEQSVHPQPCKIVKLVRAYHIQEFSQKSQKIFELNDQIFKLKSKKKEDHEEEIQELKIQIAQLKEQKQAFRKELLGPKGNDEYFTGTIFVSFQYEQQKESLQSIWDYKLFQKIFYCYNEQRYEGNLLYVHQAAEPSDICWENIGVDMKIKYQNRLKTLVVISIAFLFSCLIIAGIQSGQLELSSEQGAGIQVLSILLSIIISVINFLIISLIDYFAIREFHESRTRFFLNYAIYVGLAQFFNYGVTLYLTYLYLSEVKGQNINVYNNAGLLNQAFNNQVVACITTPFSMIISNYVQNFLKYYYRRSIEKEAENCQLTQKQANFYYQGVDFNPALEYGQIMRVVLLSVFYSYMIPLGLVVTIVTVIGMTFAQRYSLLRLCCRPSQLDSDLPIHMLNSFSQVLLLVFAIGILINENHIFKGNNILTIVLLIAAKVFFVIPTRRILGLIFGLDAFIDKMPYETYQQDFKINYDEANPIQIASTINSLGANLNEDGFDLDEAEEFENLIKQNYNFDPADPNCYDNVKEN